MATRIIERPAQLRTPSVRNALKAYPARWFGILPAGDAVAFVVASRRLLKV
jgi:hypothetical protein